jgi:hypothetical protein
MKNKTIMTPLEFLKAKKIEKGTFYTSDKNGGNQQTFYIKDVAALMDEYLVSFMSEAVDKHNKQKENENTNQNRKRCDP